MNFYICPESEGAAPTPCTSTDRPLGLDLTLTAKGGRVVVTNIHPYAEQQVSMNLSNLTGMEKQVVGSLFGSANPRADIPRLLELDARGQFDLGALITRSYPLEGVNDGYRDLMEGRNIRGILVLDKELAGG